ncbi:MAG: DUF2079 domain-containing protein [Thermoplasmata archaeon]|nr:DUF2079 domain-containing protein [Thermoplasmata archaeon]
MTVRTDPPSDGPTLGALPRWLRRRTPRFWLASAIVVYFSVSLALSWLRATELLTTTWDQGIYQQALWSTAHGRPFYESADLETGGYRSLLQVHTVFLFYLLAPMYAAFPYQVTLFAVQSLVVAAAAVPLYLLGRDLTRSPWWGLVVPLVYLVWTPTLSSTLYDFHPEAFLPLELFTVVLLWERGRYRAGAIAVLVAFSTIELAPVLLLFVGVFFLAPNETTWRRWKTAARGRFPWTAWISDLRPALSSPRVQASVTLLVASLVVYFLLLYLRLDVLNVALGTETLPVAATGYVIGGTPSPLGLSWQNLWVGFDAKLTYWFLMLALLGFVPLLAPRALILSLPWFGFTMLSANTNYVELGFQYGFIVAASMMVAFAYGLPRAVALAEAWAARPSGIGNPSATTSATGTSGWSHRRRRAMFVAVAVVFVGANLAFSPINPLIQNQGLGSGYLLSYSPSAGYANVEKLAALIPAGASVIATDNLFPLVANDENAYSFSWVQDNFLAFPFNSSHLPQYVFLAQDRTPAVPAWLSGALYDASEFGVRGEVWFSTVGTVLLFDRGYDGPATAFGSPPSFPLVETGADLVDTEAGYVPASAGSGSSSLAASAPGVLGTIFYGPWTSLPAGNFTVTLLVNASPIAGAPAPNGAEPTLWIGASAYAQAPYFGWSLTLLNFEPHGWTTVTIHLSLSAPTIEFAVQGVILGTNVQASLESFEIDLA